jgi:hypothetical protein
MQPGVEVDWEDMKVGKTYLITLRDPTEAPVKGRLLYKSDTMASVDYSAVDRDEVDRIYAPKTKATEFAKKLTPVSVAKKLPHELTAKVLEMGTGTKPKGYPKGAFTAVREATRRSRAEVPGEEELAVGRGRRRRRRTTRRRR